MKSLSIIFTILISISLAVGDFNISDDFKYARDAIYAKHNRNALDDLYKQLNISSDDDSARIDRRIVGGEVATLGQFPYQTLIYMYDDETNSYLCGGVLVRLNFVLTVSNFFLNYQNHLIIFNFIIRRLIA